MPHDPELEGFLKAVSSQRDEFVNAVNAQNWNTQLRMAAESILIFYDQLKDRIQKPLYKPLLGPKTAFPVEWAGIMVVIDSYYCNYSVFTDAAALASLAALPTGLLQKHFFFSWDELQAALAGPERENRQLHVMADLVSWYCVGKGGVQLPNSQLEIF